MSSSTPMVLFVQNSSTSDSVSSTGSKLTLTEKLNKQNSSERAVMEKTDLKQEDTCLRLNNLTKECSDKESVTPKYILIPTKSDNMDATESDSSKASEQTSFPKYLLVPAEMGQQADISKSVFVLSNSDVKTILPLSYPPNKLPLPKLLPQDLLYECKECTKTFPRKKDLKEHENIEHVKKEKVKKPAGNFVCSLCNKVFSTKKGESSHRIHIHGVRKNKKYIRCRETACDEVFGRIAELRNHLRNMHKFYEIENTKELKFSTKEEFNHWLASEEVLSKTHFISLVSERECSGYTFSEFGCNRGGIYHPQGPSEGKIPRNIKAQGTSKIGFQCTARVRVKDFKSHVEVTYFPEHYKHEKSLSHLPLPKLEKDVIKEKLMQGVDDKKILQDLKLSMTDIERKHLVTRKHLDNFKRQLGIRRSSAKPVIDNDEESVFSWAEEMKHKDYNPVLLYKRQSEEFDGLDYNDFILVLMTAFQRTMLAEFSYNTVCIHCMDRISDYDFELLTLVLANKYEEGVPVAFCIVSTVCEETVSVFLNCVKRVQNLKPAIFIGSDMPLFYSAWEKTFNSCEQCFLCSWHVMSQWQNQLNMIKKKSKKDEIYRVLKSLMYERDDAAFNRLLENFAQFNDDDDTREFYDYFMLCYYVRSYMWAYCFRKDAKIESELHINIFHKNLRQLLLGKKPRRIDKCIVKLVNLVSDKKFSDFIKSQKKSNDQSFEALEIPFFNEDDNIEWEIVSESGNSYRIIKDNTFSENAAILPHSVSHVFKCTCDDYTLSNMSCKHINFMLQFTQTNSSSVVKTTDVETNISTEIPTTPLLENSSHIPLSLQKQIASVISKLNCVQNLDDSSIAEINQHLKHIDSLNNITKPTVSEPSNIPVTHSFSTKDNVAQKRFFSVKRESANKKARLSIEVTDEELVTAESILEHIISVPEVQKFS